MKRICGLNKNCRSTLRMGAFLIISCCCVALAAQDVPAKIPKTTIRVGSWLAVGPMPSPLPAFSGSGDKPFGVAELLNFEPAHVDGLKPQAGGQFLWADGTVSRWRALAAGDKGAKIEPSGAAFETAYLTVFIDAARYVPARISLLSAQPFQAYLDGRPVASKNTAAKTEGTAATAEPAAAGPVTAELKLETGEHLLAVKSVYDRSAGTEWSMDAWLETEERFGPSTLSIAAGKDKLRMSMPLLLDGPKPSRVSVSPDGSHIALSLRQTKPPSDESESWAEIFRTQDGASVRTLRWPGASGAVEWTGDGLKFSTRSSDKSGGTIWLGDVADGSLKPILTGVPKLGLHTWARDGSFLIYEVSEDGPKDIEGVKRHRGLPDREPGFRSRTSLYRLAPLGGARQRLTAGDLSTRVEDISPDNRRVLVSRTILDPTVRPYSQTELSALDLKTLETSVVWKGSWLNSAAVVSRWEIAPHARRPVAFRRAGRQGPEGHDPQRIRRPGLYV